MQYQVIITPSAKADIFETNAWFLESHPDLAENGFGESAKPLFRSQNSPKDVRLVPKVNPLM